MLEIFTESKPVKEEVICTVILPRYEVSECSLTQGIGSRKMFSSRNLPKLRTRVDRRRLRLFFQWHLNSNV